MSKFSSDTILFFGWNNKECLKIIKYLLPDTDIKWMNKVFDSYVIDEIDKKLHDINVLLKQYDLQCDTFRGINIHECTEQTKIILYIGKTYGTCSDEIGRISASLLSYQKIKKYINKYN